MADVAIFNFHYFAAGYRFFVGDREVFDDIRTDIAFVSWTRAEAGGRTTPWMKISTPASAGSAGIAWL